MKFTIETVRTLGVNDTSVAKDENGEMVAIFAQSQIGALALGAFVASIVQKFPEAVIEDVTNGIVIGGPIGQMID